MTQDSTTTPIGQTDLHPGMMGDGTEEQNLNQTGNPSARIKQDEVDAAFARAPETRSFATDDEDGDDYYAEASEGPDDDDADRLSFLADSVTAIRDQVQQSAEAARAWASRQAAAAKQTAADKPVLVVSASAGAALAIGLAIGFIVGRASADEY